MSYDHVIIVAFICWLCELHCERFRLTVVTLWGWAEWIQKKRPCWRSTRKYLKVLESVSDNLKVFVSELICPTLSIKSLIVWNTWLYGPQFSSAFEVVRFTGWWLAGWLADWHAEHFQSNQLSRGEGWDDTCNNRDTDWHHDTILAPQSPQSKHETIKTITKYHN